MEPSAAIAPTRALARFAREARARDLPTAVRHEAKRAVLNWIGCAVGASAHATVERELAALLPFAGPAQASILGRSERIDILNAALTNGTSSHTFDFDDTHLRTVIHPAGPVASALLALSEFKPCSGADFLHALAIGVDVECRIGNAVYPSHYDVGWHITGTTGVFGAAAACGRMLGLTEEQLVWALGIAATTACGLREMFGSMCKPLHVGWAAKSGLTAALLAQRDFTSSEHGIEGRRAFANVLATERNYAEITDELGGRWELSRNTYKPFACGIVVHPTIDGCIALKQEHRLRTEDIAAIGLGVHPLVLELTGKREPKVGLEGKFSVFHCAAVAIVDGAGGVAQFSDARVRDAEVVALRNRVNAAVDPSLAEDQAVVTIVLRDGRTLTKRVEHAIGSLDHPMTDVDLERKLHGLCDEILGAQRADELVAACWDLDESPNAGDLARRTVPV
ncbi:MAG TPA: MmgE/PrpD family protein [Casimicrobiaceae bacterium]|nr:MmgE/PrpD family protein [Casimicrobiaceae bacterium]